MGTEPGVADASDISAACVGFPPNTSAQVTQRSFSFPFAVAAVGPQHIIDGIIRDT